MKTVESIKSSIRSAEDLGSVVRTMKTLAAVNIRQYEAAVEALSEYSRTIQTGLRMLLRDGAGERPGSGSPGSSTGMIVFGSDQGMCGQFNEQICRYTEELPDRQESRSVPVLCVGHRVSDLLRDNRIPVERTFDLPGSAEGTTSLVHDLLPVIDEWRETHRIGRILVAHNLRQSASTWKPHSFQLLPLQLPPSERPSRRESATACLPYWTMPTPVLFSRLVRQFLFVSLFRACAESQAGENASRIAAMQSAERNISDRLRTLRTQHAQTRQNSITEELLDVVTGFEALQTKTRVKSTAGCDGTA